MSDADRRRYCRVYYERFISEYPHLYDNSTVLGDWLKLLIASEQAWPTDPELPRTVRSSSVTTLVAEGVLQVTGHRYHLRGFQAERERRAQSGRTGAALRWQNDGNANAVPSHNERNASTRTSTRELEGKQGLRALDAREASGRVDPVKAS